MRNKIRNWLDRKYKNNSMFYNNVMVVPVGENIVEIIFINTKDYDSINVVLPREIAKDLNIKLTDRL